jgi:hypothetical protein
METVRIELPGNAYATAFKDVLRKTARLHEAELRKVMTPIDATTGKVLLSELEAAPQAQHKVDYKVDLLAIDQDKVNEIFILNQVAEWSFGPVDYDTLENLVSREQYKALVKEFDRLYKPVPLAGSA